MLIPMFRRLGDLSTDRQIVDVNVTKNKTYLFVPISFSPLVIPRNSSGYLFSSGLTSSRIRNLADVAQEQG